MRMATGFYDARLAQAHANAPPGMCTMFDLAASLPRHGLSLSLLMPSTQQQLLVTYQAAMLPPKDPAAHSSSMGLKPGHVLLASPHWLIAK